MQFESNKNKKQIKRFPENKNERGYELEDDIRSDIMGSYTGVPLEGEMPVQDADDL